MSKPTLNKKGAHHNQCICWAFVLRVLKSFDVTESCFRSLPSTWLCNTRPGLSRTRRYHKTFCPVNCLDVVNVLREQRKLKQFGENNLMVDTLRIQITHSSNPIFYFIATQCRNIRIPDNYYYFFWCDGTLQLITTFKKKISFSFLSALLWSPGGSQAAKQNLRRSGRQYLRGDNYPAYSIQA